MNLPSHFFHGGRVKLAVLAATLGLVGTTQAMVLSADETADVGIDLATPVVEAIGAERKSKFNGRIPKLTVGVK